MLIGVAKLKYEVIEGSTWYLIVFSIVSYVLAIRLNQIVMIETDVFSICTLQKYEQH